MRPVTIKITSEEIKKNEKPSTLKNLSDFFTSPKKTSKSASRSLEFEEGSETQISTSVTADFPQGLFYDRKDSETSERINEKEIEDSATKNIIGSLWRVY